MVDEKNEGTSVIAPSKYIAPFLTLIAGVLIVFSAVVVVVGIVELSARVTTGSLIERAINDLNEEVANNVVIRETLRSSTDLETAQKIVEHLATRGVKSQEAIADLQTFLAPLVNQAKRFSDQTAGVSSEPFKYDDNPERLLAINSLVDYLSASSRGFRDTPYADFEENPLSTRGIQQLNAELQSTVDEQAAFVGSLAAQLDNIKLQTALTNDLDQLLTQLTLLETVGARPRDNGGYFDIEWIQEEFSRLARGGGEQQASHSQSWFGVITGLSNDLILGIVLSLSGVLGAVVAGLREQFLPQRNSSSQSGYGLLLLKDFFMGISAGFITFLVLKGGKFVFLIETSIAEVQTNPYGSSFVAVLAGLFTERVYRVISTLFNRVAETVENGELRKPDSGV